MSGLHSLSLTLPDQTVRVVPQGEDRRSDYEKNRTLFFLRSFRSGLSTCVVKVSTGLVSVPV